MFGERRSHFLAFSKSFVNEIQIDLSTSLPVYMLFGKAPVLEVAPQDVDEIRQLFQLIKTMLRSDKERYPPRDHPHALYHGVLHHHRD